MTFYGVLWAESASDVIADNLHISLYTITWIARVMVFLGPVLAYVITKRLCLGLQRKDAGELLHGYESGIIRQLPDGRFVEVHKPVNEERRAVLESKPAPALPPGRGAEDTNGIPTAGSHGALGRARAMAGRAFAETIPLETNGNGNGHRPAIAGKDVVVRPNGDGRTEAVGAASSAQPAPGDRQES
jgi:ubiquinol-cytochrome c reductase cytochrome b subunit